MSRGPKNRSTPALLEPPLPHPNRFRHQRYDDHPPTVDVAWLDAVAPPPVDSDAWKSRMAQAGAAISSAGVNAIYLLHGTFVGVDIVGLNRLVELLSTTAAMALREQEKRFADRIVRDAGNYTPEVAAVLERGLNSVPARLFFWSSENHHLGRADGAVGLIDELSRHRWPEGARVLLWGHSHGGNVLALASNLLGADASSRAAFFSATRPFRLSRLVSPAIRARWARVQQLLEQSDAPIRRLALDIVTFGTPIRYGWDSGGYSRLLHVIYHRPTPGLPAYATRFPFSVRSAMTAKRGDYVQQVGIAGTNFAPPLPASPLQVADRRLHRLLQSDHPLGGSAAWWPRSAWRWLEAGRRVPDEGETLLIDYHRAAPRYHQGARGHAIYTRVCWLLYHVELLTARWYRSGAGS